MFLSSVPGAAYGDNARQWLYNKTGFSALKHSLIVPKTGSKNVFNIKPVSGMDTDGIPVYMKEDVSFFQCLKDDVRKFRQNMPVGSTIAMRSKDELFQSENDGRISDLSHSNNTQKQKDDESQQIAVRCSRSVSFLSNLMKKCSKIINLVNEKAESITSNELREESSKLSGSLASIALMGVDASINIAEKLPIMGRLVKFTKKTLLPFKGASCQDMETFAYAPGVKNIFSFSFSGRSLNPSYEIGAAKCFTEYINKSILDTSSYVGSATGALIATAMALDLDLDILKTALNDMSLITSKRIIGSFSIRSKLMKDFLYNYIPDEVNLLPNQLCILITSFPDMKSHIRQQFSSKKELIETLMASLYIPLMYETPITDSQKMYFSGNFSDDLPVLDELTITVSSKFNSANVSPVNDSFSLRNYFGLNWTWDTCTSHFQQGYGDAVKYLQSLHKQPITILFFSKTPTDE